MAIEDEIGASHFHDRRHHRTIVALNAGSTGDLHAPRRLKQEGDSYCRKAGVRRGAPQVTARCGHPQDSQLTSARRSTWGSTSTQSRHDVFPWLGSPKTDDPQGFRPPASIVASRSAKECLQAAGSGRLARSAASA
jgi:hypothetical protein